ncbi:very short patch repair endonuclease [Tardiphaga robiniae]|uniref:very short patch repair endonuclease n=1 Tax=Tardiphaga robiniae TaxID=943830 RepID=UPI00158637AC|nr:very short patch repair endonuclease [Tardiphaga robiniae]NUU41849.1 very short patch repair endonuclease [Tardiphaga robiniae]
MARRSPRQTTIAAGKSERLHRGDIMSPEKRSALMSRIRGKGTKPELAVAALLAGTGLTWEEHAKDLPGRPDFVLREQRIAIFVDGDFWHGWRFPAWRMKLSEKWERKIAANRMRDARNFRALRRAGWSVIRIWEHQIEKDPAGCIARILSVQQATGLASNRQAWHD